MKFTNVKQLIIKFFGGGIINFPTRFLRWVKINGDTDNSDDGGGDTPVSDVKPWLKGLCINENLPEDVEQLKDCFHNAGFAIAPFGGSLQNITKLTDEEIENYNEESLTINDTVKRIKCLFDAEKIEEYLTQEGVEIPEINNTVFIPYNIGDVHFLVEVNYYYQTSIAYSLPYKDDYTNIYGITFAKIRTTNNEIYYIVV